MSMDVYVIVNTIYNQCVIGVLLLNANVVALESGRLELIISSYTPVILALGLDWYRLVLKF